MGGGGHCPIPMMAPSMGPHNNKGIHLIDDTITVFLFSFLLKVHRYDCWLQLT